MRKLLILALLSTLLLSACGKASQAENAGKAMAETACLLFNNSGDLSNLETESNTIMTKYGWKDPAEIDTYLNSVRNTAEFNEINVAARTHLEESCGDALAKAGVSAEELSSAMTSE